MVATFRCKLSVCVTGAIPVLHTHKLFDARYKEPPGSPIDEFLTRLQLINLLAPHPNSFDPLQGQLVLLGVIAAVESYLRTIFRQLIVVDPTCQESVHKRDVSFGAAMHLPKDMLPEAILERIAFVSYASIVDALRDLLGVKGPVPSDLDAAIRAYVRVCQLRHCAVHRFGKLGVSNAIALGLADHTTMLEKPLNLNYAALQAAISISTGLVKTTNNFLFNEILSRIPHTSWTGEYTDDRSLFMRYYVLFADKISTFRSAAPKKIYLQMEKQRTMFANDIDF